MGMTERDAAIMQDELGDPGAVVGTPAELGASRTTNSDSRATESRNAPTSRLSFAGFDLQASSVVIQGFGAVGHAAAKRLSELGATIVAVSTTRGAIATDDGLDVERLLQLRSEFGDDLVSHYPGARELPVGDELLIPADILIPAAQQDVIDEQVCNRTAGTCRRGGCEPTGNTRGAGDPISARRDCSTRLHRKCRSQRVRCRCHGRAAFLLCAPRSNRFINSLPGR